MKQGFTTVFISEIKRIANSYRLLFLILGFPVGLFIYYTELFSKGIPEELPIVLLDQDNSKLSRQLSRMFQVSPSLHIVAENIEEERAKSMIRTDRALGFIIIPSGFENNLYRGENSQVVGYYNNQYLLTGGLINKAVQTIVETFSAGIHINTLQQSGQTPYQAYSNTLPVNIDLHILYNPYTSYAYFLLSALNPMAFHIIIMVVTLYALGRPLKYNKGKEILGKGKGRVLNVFLGIILPYTLLFMVVGFFMNSLTFYKVGTPFKGSIITINLCTILLILTIQSLALLFISVTTSLRTALTFGGGFASLSFSFVGYTFPIEGLPKIIQYLTSVFPLTSYLKLIVNLGIKGQGISGNLIHFFILLFMIIVGLGSMYVYKKRLKSGGYHA